MIKIEDFTKQELVNAIVKYLREEAANEDLGEYAQSINEVVEDIAQNIECGGWLQGYNETLMEEAECHLS